MYIGADGQVGPRARAVAGGRRQVAGCVAGCDGSAAPGPPLGMPLSIAGMIDMAPPSVLGSERGRRRRQRRLRFRDRHVSGACSRDGVSRHRWFRRLPYSPDGADLLGGRRLVAWSTAQCVDVGCGPACARSRDSARCRRRSVSQAAPAMGAPGTWAASIAGEDGRRGQAARAPPGTRTASPASSRSRRSAGNRAPDFDDAALSKEPPSGRRGRPCGRPSPPTMQEAQACRCSQEPSHCVPSEGFRHERCASAECGQPPRRPCRKCGRSRDTCLPRHHRARRARPRSAPRASSRARRGRTRRRGRCP